MVGGTSPALRNHVGAILTCLQVQNLVGDQQGEMADKEQEREPNPSTSKGKSRGRQKRKAPEARAEPEVQKEPKASGKRLEKQKNQRLLEKVGDPTPFGDLERDDREPSIVEELLPPPPKRARPVPEPYNSEKEEEAVPVHLEAIIAKAIRKGVVEKPPVYISPKETADFTKIAQMLQNATLARHAIGMIKNFSNYYSLREYLFRLQKGPCQDTSSPSTCRQSSFAFTVEIQQEILENALFFLKKEGSSMNSSQWTEAYFLLFSNILPYPRTAHLSQLAPKLSCHLHTILKAITALHPSLIKQEEELAKVRPLCYPGKHHPNIKATTHILAKVTKYTYQDETHSKHRIGTTFPHQTSKSHILGDTTKQNLESSPGNKLRSKEMDTTGRAIIHNLRNNTSGFFESVANKPIPIPGGATKSILQSIITHISGIPRFTSPQSARTNTLGDATNDVTRNTTDDLTGNITTHGLGRTSRHISGSSRTDIPRTTIVDIHRRTSTWIPNSVTQISRSDSNDIFGRGNIPESAMLDISESTARWSTVQMFEKTTSGFHGNITHHYPKSFASEMPNDITKLENTITYIPGNDNGKILASGTDNNYGNSSTCTIPHNYGGSTSRIQESISANFHGTDKTHIPGYTTENILMDSRIHSLGITVENNSSDAKGNIYEIAITHNPADATVNQHTVHILESKNENVSHSVMKYILKSSIPPSINDAMGMPGIILDYTSRSIPAEGVTDNIPSTFTGNILGNTAGKTLESITAHFPSVRSSNIPGDAISNYFEGTTFHTPGDAATSIPTNNITHNLRGTTSNILKNEGTTGDVTDNVLTGIRRHILRNALGNTSNASANTPRINPRRLTIHKPEDVNSKFLKGIVTNIPEDATIKMSGEVTANIDGAVTSNLSRDVTFILGTHSNWTDVTRYVSKVFISISQSAVCNIPNDDLAHVTGNMLENITIHTQSNIDTMGNSPRDTANNIPGGTTTSIFGSVINNVSEDTSVHSCDGVTSKFSSSITFQMVTGATVNILKSITASVLRSTTGGEYIPSLKNSTYHGATGNLSGETTGNVNGSDTILKTYDATGNKPKISITHSPGNGAMNYISGGVTTPFSKSTTGNMFQNTPSNAKKIAMGYDHKAVNIHEGTMGNISGGAIIHIPGDTTASIPHTNKNLGSAISNNEASVIYKARNVTATISIASGGHHISSDLTLNISKGTIPEGSTVHIPSSVTENKTTLFLDGFSSNITISVPDHIRDNDYVGTLGTIPGSNMGDIPQNTISGVVPSIASDNDRNKDATPSTDVITPIFGGVSVKLLSGFTSNHAGNVTSNIPIDTTSIFKDATVSIPMGSTKYNLEDKATHVHDGSLGNSHNDATGSISQKFTSPISGSTSSTISTIFGGGSNYLPGKGNEDGAPGGPNHDNSGDVTISIFTDAITHDPTFVPDKGNSWANNTVPMSFYCVLTWISVMVSL
ncbi:sraP, partial [Ophiophagus hannah]